MAFLPPPFYDSLISANPHTKESLVNDDSWTIVDAGNVSNDPAGVIFANGTNAGFHRAQAEGDWVALIECKIDALFDSGFSLRHVAGWHPDSDASPFEVVGLGRDVLPAPFERANIVVDGVTINGRVEAGAMFLNVGDVFKAILISKTDAGRPFRHFQAYAVGVTTDEIHSYWHSSLAGAARTKLFIGGGASDLGLGSNITAPVNITRIQIWNIEPTNKQVGELINGEALTFNPGNSTLITDRPVVTESSKTATSITLDLTHPANTEKSMIMWRTNKPNSAGFLSSGNPIDPGTAQDTLSNLPVGEVILVTMISQDLEGKFSKESLQISVPLGTTGGLIF